MIFECMIALFFLNISKEKKSSYPSASKEVSKEEYCSVLIRQC